MKTLLLSLLGLTTAWATPPAVETPSAYRDEPVPADAVNASRAADEATDIANGEWWRLFQDPGLDELERLALTANQDLRVAAARVEASRAAAGLARSAYWPQVALQPGVTRERTSATTDNAPPNALTRTYRAPLTFAWEIDLFGRVRHLSASARADAAASEATFAAVRLALAAEVAVQVFSVRAAEREAGVLRASAALRRQALALARARFAGGIAADLDVARAEAELAATEADSAGVELRRATLQHALAVLVGAPAPDFVPPAAATTAGDGEPARAARLFSTRPPRIPAGLPATLLQRRPDLAAAAHALTAAQERIGVARAAFFPAISLTGGAGFASGELDRLFEAGSRAWGIGPSVYLPIFQGGRNRATLARRRAELDGAVAGYRQQVLVAFREVQDALTATRLLEVQAEAQTRAVAAARHAAQLAQTRYAAGFVSQLEVIDAQRTLLEAERTAVRLDGVRLNASVALIKALGGGWTTANRLVAAAP